MLCETVGHVPHKLLQTVWHFLMHGGQFTCEFEVTGRRKLGHGLEVPCVYRFTGPRKLVNRMEQLLCNKNGIRFLVETQAAALISVSITTTAVTF